MNAPTLPLNAIAVPAPRAAVLPPLSRAGTADGLTPAQRRLMIAAIVAAHAAGAWGLMQIGAVREAVREAAPRFVDLIAPPAPPAPPVPPPPKPQPIQKKPPPPAPLIAAATSPAPAAFVVPAPPPEPIAVPAPPAPPAPAPQLKTIPASAVQYLVEPAPEYPRLSSRAGEAGRVIVLVFINEAGQPGQVQVGKSSGFARLDAAAIAAVQRARFRPPTLNGQPISGWANVPIDFGLEK